MGRFLSFAAFLISTFTISVFAAEPENLVQNSGFEEDVSFWIMGANAKRSEDDKYKGNYSGKISATKPGTGAKIRLTSDFIPYSGGPLKVSAWLKASNITQGNREWNVGLFHVMFYDKAKKKIGPHSCVTNIKGDTNWTEAKREYYPLEAKKDKWHTIPAGTKFLKVEFLLSNCTGILYVDEVRIIGKKESCPGKTPQKASPKKKMSAAEKAEYDRLLLATRKPLKKKLNNDDSNENLIVMDDVFLAKKKLDPLKKYPNLPKLEVKNGDIYLNGKPSMMIGIESAFNIYPANDKLLGLDYITFNVSDSANTVVKKIDERSYHVSWEDYTWLDTIMNTAAEEGLWCYIDFWMGGNFVKKQFPRMFIQDPPQHFIWLRFTSPEARRYINNYSKSLAKITRKYPVFAYELLNEIMYTSPYHPVNLAMFREKMAKKYKNIEAANKDWGTYFNNFAEVVPPKKGGVSGQVMNLPKGFSQKLFYEYTKFSEGLIAKHVHDWKNEFKKYEPDGMVLIQATNNMWMDYGNQGINPELMVKNEEALGCECGITYTPQPLGAEDLESIKNMTLRLLTRDVWRSVSPNKPLIDGESPLSVSTPPSPAPFVNLEGKWKFKNYASDEGKKERKSRTDAEDKDSDKSWTKIDYNDSEWKNISVPAMWGKEGFAKTYIGLYRKNFKLPEGYDGPLYITGKSLADYADIYINGKLVHKTKMWSEDFCVNISNDLNRGSENVIAIRVFNKYFEGGMYWGGIRGGIQLVKSSTELQPLTEGQMRSYLWSSAVHGYSAATVSYYYASEGIDYPFSLLNPTRTSAEALKAIPKVGMELKTLAEIVLPRPRIKGKAALLYPFEYFRYHVPEDTVEALRAPLSKDLLDYYQAFLFSQIPLDMITSSQILEGKANKYKALIFRKADIVKPGVADKLNEYVKNGGVLVIDHGSLQKEDEFLNPIDISALTGVKEIKALNSPSKIIFRDKLLPETVTVKRQSDGASGAELENLSANVLASYENSQPAITMKESGKGKVYYIACELPYEARKDFLTEIMKENGITPDISISHANGTAKFVEAHKFSKDKRAVWYLNNWGEDAKIKVVPEEKLPDNKSYRVREIVSNSLIKSPSNSESWKGSELNNGMAIALPSQNPRIYLIEDENLAPLPRLELTKKHKDKLERVWKKSPEAESRILIDAKRNTQYSKSRTPSLVWLLENNGFQLLNSVGRIGKEVKTVNKDIIGKEQLSTFNVLSLPGVPGGIGHTRGFSDEELQTIKNYVENGGGLFITAQFMHGPHGHMSSAYASKVAQLFGVRILRDAVSDPANHIKNEARFVTYKNIKKSSVTTGVKLFQSMGMAPLKISNPDAQALIISSDKSSSKILKNGKIPALVAIEYGKGRVVVMGDASWMLPNALVKADNAQLALNIFNWLAKRPIKIEDRKKLLEIIDFSLK
jgi:beta-galactosidase GanA